MALCAVLQFAYDHDCRTSPTWLSDNQIQLFFNRFENDFKEIAKLYGVKGIFKGPWNNPVIRQPTCNVTRDEIYKRLETFYIVPSFFSSLKAKTKLFLKSLSWNKYKIKKHSCAFLSKIMVRARR